MPKAKNPVVFEKAYMATVKLLAEETLPTRHIGGMKEHIFRYVYREHIKKPAPGRFATIKEQNDALSPFDEFRDKNRWSGKSPVLSIPSRGGLYCSIHPHALINEIRHANPNYNPQWSDRKLKPLALVEIKLGRTFFMLDLSPANAGAWKFWHRFFKRSGLKEEIHSPRLEGEDCSIQRAVGLAVAQCPFLHGLIAHTVRTSERSDAEKGENIIFFGANEKPIPNLVVEKITYIDP